MVTPPLQVLVVAEKIKVVARPSNFPNHGHMEAE
jgi:hypothetical protein